MEKRMSNEEIDEELEKIGKELEKIRQMVSKYKERMLYLEEQKRLNIADECPINEDGPAEIISFPKG